jgi:hypothetical protein
MLSLMFVSALSSNAWAAPISLDDDVSVEWGNFRCYPDYNLNACPHDAAIIGGIRLFTPDQRDELTVTIDFNTTEQEIEEFQFFLHVGGPSLEQILIGAIPLVLSTDPLFSFDKDIDVQLSLADFVNGGVLPAGDLTFSLTGRLIGKSSFGECFDDAFLNDGDRLDVIAGVPERVCGVEGAFSTDPPATIYFTGGTEVTPQQVPEPGTLLLLIGGVGFGGVSRFRTWRNAQSKVGRQSPD